MKRGMQAHIQCYNCNKHGSYAKECRSKDFKENTTFSEKKTWVEPTILLAYNGKGGIEQRAWYLDTAASNQERRTCYMFVELNESIKGQVTFKNGLPIYRLLSSSH